TGEAARLAFGAGPAGVVDDHAAQQAAVAGGAQADAEVAAEGPSGGEEPDAPAAGRAAQVQLALRALESLEDGLVRHGVPVAARVPVGDPAVAPDSVAATPSTVGAGTDRHRRIVLDRTQSRGR